MYLSYRGSLYRPANLGYETVPSETVGIYRGYHTLLQTSRQARSATSLAQLTYRGSRYQSPRYDISPLAASLAVTIATASDRRTRLRQPLVMDDRF